MKRLLTATLAGLALFAFAPVDADAGNKKNKHHKSHSYSGKNYNKSYSSNYRGYNNRSYGSVRYSSGPVYRNYYRPIVPRSYGYSRVYVRPPVVRVPSPFFFFGGGGGYCR